MYADLLKQSYGIEVTPENLRIIPIKVNYPTPLGSREDYLDPKGPEYSEIKTGEKKGQLQTKYRGETEAQDFNDLNPRLRSTEVKGQIQPGYTAFNINWDNLSSEDQDIASALTTQTGGQGSAGAPASAHIETPQKRTPSFMDMGNIGFGEHQEAGPTAPPIVSNGATPILPEWRKLSNAAKGFLAEKYGIETVEQYNDILNDPTDAEAIAHVLKDCFKL
jgi:hypothetical protein